MKPDGSEKLRPIDDFSKSGCNEATHATEKLKYDACEVFLATLREASAQLGMDLSLWKADIGSAFRRIPVAPEQRNLAWVAFVHDGKTIAAQHLCLPFGSIASVHHWDRLGALIRAIARRILHLPVLRLRT